MYVGMAKLSLVIAQSTSLKDKRMVIRRIKDRVRERIGVVVNEVGAQDDRQRAELGCAVTSADRAKALELIDQVIRIAQAASDGQVVATAKDAWTFDAELDPLRLPVLDGVSQERSGSPDKAAGLANEDWIPEAWREEE